MVQTPLRSALFYIIKRWNYENYDLLIKFCAFTPAWLTQQKVAWNLDQRPWQFVIMNKPTKAFALGQFLLVGLSLCFGCCALKQTDSPKESIHEPLDSHSIQQLPKLFVQMVSHLHFRVVSLSSTLKLKGELNHQSPTPQSGFYHFWAITPDGLKLLRNWHMCYWLAECVQNLFALWD